MHYPIDEKTKKPIVQSAKTIEAKQEPKEEYKKKKQ